MHEGLEVIAKRYRKVVGGTVLVDYRSFTRDLDQYGAPESKDAESKAAAGTMLAVRSKGASVEPLDVILHRIRIFAIRRQIRTEDFFSDFDALHHGTITKTRFHRGLVNLLRPSLVPR